MMYLFVLHGPVTFFFVFFFFFSSFDAIINHDNFTPLFGPFVLTYRLVPTLLTALI